MAANTPVNVVKGSRYRMELLFSPSFTTVEQFQLLAHYLKTPKDAVIVSLTNVRASVSFIASKSSTLWMGSTLCTIRGAKVVIGRISYESLAK